MQQATKSFVVASCFHKSLWMVYSGIGAYFGAQCEKNGMLVRVAGDNIMMCPPFIMTPNEIDEVGPPELWMDVSIILIDIWSQA